MWNYDLTLIKLTLIFTIYTRFYTNKDLPGSVLISSTVGCGGLSEVGSGGLSNSVDVDIERD